MRAQGRPEEAIPEYEAAIAHNHNSVHAIFSLGQCKFLTGSLDEVIPAQERAIRLSPRDPSIYLFYSQIGLVHLVRSRTDEAIVWFEKASKLNSVQPGYHAYLASAYAIEGDFERAATELSEARRLSGDDRYTSITRLKARYWGVPKIRALFEATYFAGLRKAGMPEE